MLSWCDASTQRQWFPLCKDAIQKVCNAIVVNVIAYDNLIGNRTHYTGKSSDCISLFQWTKKAYPWTQGPYYEWAANPCRHVGVSVDIILPSDISERCNKCHFKDMLSILPLYSVIFNIGLHYICRSSDIQSDCSLTKHDRVTVSRTALILHLRDRGFCDFSVPGLLDISPEVKKWDEFQGAWWPLFTSPLPVKMREKCSPNYSRKKPANCGGAPSGWKITALV